MAATPEQVRKLSRATGVDEIAALSALERQNGDLLEAALELERQGSARPPAGGGFYSTRPPGAAPPAAHTGEDAAGGAAGEARSGIYVISWEHLSGELKRLFHRGMDNYLEIRRRGERAASVPLLILAVLLVWFFWILPPLLALGLILGFRYRLGGPDMDRESLDRAMKKAADAASKAVCRAASRLRSAWERRRR